MDTSTGKIMPMSEVQKILLEHPDREEQFVRLTPEQKELLSGKNRKDRREYFRKHKKEFKGVSWSDLHK